jgi:tRNA (mo5U34)-methyltransferase
MDYSLFYQQLANTSAASWLEILPAQVDAALDPQKHGDWNKWLILLEKLPRLPISHIDLNSPAITVTGGYNDDLKDILKQLHPWRKGGFQIHNVHIDTEWRSDFKWARIEKHISLKDKVILDVGCGNGYYAWRMVGAGAKLVVGIDPTLINVVQFHAVKHFLGDFPLTVLPLGIEAVPPDLKAFDTVFSMGVLYHRRSPLDHLLELKGCLRNGGELVLETLIIEGEEGRVLMPEQRYAKMRNVWFIPSVATLELWLKRCGFQNVRCVDVSTVTLAEQRRTDWMWFESLGDFLNPHNPSQTIEGYPRPRRAVFLATA